MELISDVTVTDTEDGGALISAKVSPELATLIIQSWLRGAIFDAVEQIIVREGEEPTREVPAENGSDPETGSEQNEVLQEMASRTILYNDGPPNPSDQR